MHSKSKQTNKHDSAVIDFTPPCLPWLEFYRLSLCDLNSLTAVFLDQVRVCVNFFLDSGFYPHISCPQTPILNEQHFAVRLEVNELLV